MVCLSFVCDCTGEERRDQQCTYICIVLQETQSSTQECQSEVCREKERPGGGRGEGGQVGGGGGREGVGRGRVAHC